MKVRVKDLDRYFKISRALKSRGLNFSYIAQALDITSSAVTYFSYGQYKSKRFDSWIKENLEIDL